MSVENKEKINFDIKWIATVLCIFAATSISLKAPWMKYVFPCFIMAHCIYLYDFITTHRNKALIFSNIYFLLMNIFACYVWWF